MACTLVVNPGSTSKKYALYQGERLLFSARYEKTRDGHECCVEVKGERQRVEAATEEVFASAFSHMLEHAVAAGVIANDRAISAIGVRVVAPGTYFQSHRPIDDVYVSALQDRSPFAPLHVPSVLREIAAVQERFSTVPTVGVSDSAFHASKPPEATVYSIDQETAENFDIKRFGYHGLSVASVARRLSATFGAIPERVIVCHLGGGVSVTALRAGVSIDTSMGFTPESGLMMGARAGELDAGALLALMYGMRLQPHDAHVYVNTRGGFAGLTGNADMRQALDQAALDNETAVLALDKYAYEIKKTLGAYTAILGGLDAVVLTASAAFRNPDVRALLLGDLDCLGLHIATQRNQDLIGREGFIHANGAQVQVAVMRTDEMGEIARVVQSVLRDSYAS